MNKEYLNDENLLERIPVLNLIFLQITNQRSINEISNILSVNSVLIQQIISFIRGIRLLYTYNNDKLDSGFDDVLRSSNLVNGFYARSTLGDGNCFYRSVSYLLFGTEDNYQIIKLCCIYILKEYDFFFENESKKICHEFSYKDNFIQVCQENKWADEIVFAAAAIFLNRSVVTITCTEFNKPFVLKFSFGDVYLEPLLIGYSGNHFIPILKDRFDRPLPTNMKMNEAINGENLKIKIY